MNTPPDQDATSWDALADEWQASTTPPHRPPTDLLARVRRQSRWLWAVAAAELVVCIATLLLAVDFAFGPRRSEPWSLPTAAGLALLVFVAGRHALSMRRGLWTAASARDHAGYLRLLRQRVDARRQSLRFAKKLTLTLFLVFCLWLPLTRSDGLVGAFAFLVFWCACAALWVRWLEGRARREAEALTNLESDLV